jgi:lambda family phage minor tail protein L
LAGVTYKPWPIAASGFDKNGQGKLPRPKLQVSNLDGIISAEVQSNEDLIGCKLIRRVTLARFLDAANFTEGNPTADANQHFADEMWYIDQKTFEDREIVEFELASAFDLMGVMLPNRQIVKNSCQWRYRSAECGYTGPYFDKNDAPTKLASADYCTKRLSSCRAQINYFANGIIAFGGFPGANRA